MRRKGFNRMKRCDNIGCTERATHACQSVTLAGNDCVRLSCKKHQCGCVNGVKGTIK